MRLLRHFTIDQVNLNIREKMGAVLSCFVAIFIVAMVTRFFVDTAAFPILVASMGASAVILFIIPSSPLAQPWPFAGGQLCSAVVGVLCAQYIPETAISAACAAGGSVLVMLVLRCLHPPGSATALAPVLVGTPLTSLGFDFVLIPVGTNVMIMLLMSLLINRWIMQRKYPNYRAPQKNSQDLEVNAVTLLQTISEDDLSRALNASDTFVDVTPFEIKKLLFQAEKYHFKQQHQVINCADIMTRKVMTVEYGTDVETAWQIMHQHKLKAMPVIDRANRVIGIVTWSDFFKYINLSAYDSLQDKFRAFIRRTSNINTDKPESIGHLMTKSVIVMPEDTHIVELIEPMVNSGLRQIPIVNNEHRLTGMIDQPQLIAALYRQQMKQKG